MRKNKLLILFFFLFFMSNKITKKSLKKVDRMIESKIDYNFLNTANCNKNSIKYMKNGDFIVDCFTPQKIYRYIYNIRYTKNNDKIKKTEKEIDMNSKKLETLIQKIKDGFNKGNSENLNQIREEVIQLDDKLVLLKYNLNILKDKTQNMEIDDKPSKMYVINRIKESSFIKQELVEEEDEEEKEEVQVKELTTKKKLEQINEAEQEVLSTEELVEEFNIENQQEEFADTDDEVVDKSVKKKKNQRFIKKLIGGGLINEDLLETNDEAIYDIEDEEYMNNIEMEEGYPEMDSDNYI